MNIAILGAGNSGCALAADYAARGHEVTLIKTSHSLHDENFSHLCATGGRMRIHEFGTDTDCVIAHLSRDVADVRGKDIVLLCTQTGYHHDVLRRVVPFLTAGQILLMIPGNSRQKRARFPGLAIQAGGQEYRLVAQSSAGFRRAAAQLLYAAGYKSGYIV